MFFENPIYTRLLFSKQKNSPTKNVRKSFVNGNVIYVGTEGFHHNELLDIFIPDIRSDSSQTQRHRQHPQNHSPDSFV